MFRVTNLTFGSPPDTRQPYASDSDDEQPEYYEDEVHFKLHGDPSLGGGEVPVLINRSTYQSKPFCLSSETVLPIK
jgi:hypothetical protein